MRIFYPGPVYRDDYDDDGKLIGRTLVQEGEIWLVDRPVEVVHTITPITQEGIWDAAITLDLENWAGNYGVLPDGEHKNVLEFGNLADLLSFMNKRAGADATNGCPISN